MTWVETLEGILEKEISKKRGLRYPICEGKGRKSLMVMDDGECDRNVETWFGKKRRALGP